MINITAIQEKLDKSKPNVGTIVKNEVNHRIKFIIGRLDNEPIVLLLDPVKPDTYKVVSERVLLGYLNRKSVTSFTAFFTYNFKKWAIHADNLEEFEIKYVGKLATKPKKAKKIKPKNENYFRGKRHSTQSHNF